MLSGALYPLEPPEYPPPYPPPLALAKDTVGTPIKVITISAAMSFVVFINFLSIDIIDPSSSSILAETVPRKPTIREPPGFTLCWQRSNEAPPILYTALQRSGRGGPLLPASSDPHPSK